MEKIKKRARFDSIMLDCRCSRPVFINIFCFTCITRTLSAVLALLRANDSDSTFKNSKTQKFKNFRVFEFSSFRIGRHFSIFLVFEFSSWVLLFEFLNFRVFERNPSVNFNCGPFPRRNTTAQGGGGGGKG